MRDGVGMRSSVVLSLQHQGGSLDIQLGSLEALLIRWNSPDSFQPIQTLFAVSRREGGKRIEYALSLPLVHDQYATMSRCSTDGNLRRAKATWKFPIKVRCRCLCMDSMKSFLKNRKLNLSLMSQNRSSVSAT